MKPEKVVFLDDELQRAFEELREDDPIKKGINKEQFKTSLKMLFVEEVLKKL